MSDTGTVKIGFFRRLSMRRGKESEPKSILKRSPSSLVESLPAVMLMPSAGSTTSSAGTLKETKKEKKEREQRQKDAKKSHSNRNSRYMDDASPAPIPVDDLSDDESQAAAAATAAAAAFVIGAPVPNKSSPRPASDLFQAPLTGSLKRPVSTYMADAPAPAPPTAPRPAAPEPANAGSNMHSITRTVFPSVEVVQVVADDALYATLDDLRRLVQSKGTPSSTDDDGMYISLQEIRNLHGALRASEAPRPPPLADPNNPDVGTTIDVGVTEGDDMYLSFTELRSALLSQKAADAEALKAPSSSDNIAKSNTNTATSGSHEEVANSKNDDQSNKMLRALLKASVVNLDSVDPPAAAAAGSSLSPPDAEHKHALSSALARASSSTLGSRSSSAFDPAAAPAASTNKKVKVKLSFNCDICSNSLISAFYLKDGKRYCPADYRTAFGVRCGKCNLFIEGNGVAAVGKSFHNSCLSCSSCDKTIAPGDKLMCKDDKLHCSSCTSSISMPLEACASCNGSVFGEGVKAMGKLYHPSCFCCAECKHQLTSQYYSKDDKPYCDTDYKALFTRKCGVCSEGINPGQSFQIGQQFFHIPCLKCELCSKGIQPNEAIFLRDNKPCHCECMCCSKCKVTFGPGDTIYSSTTQEMFCGDCAGVTPAPSAT